MPVPGAFELPLAAMALAKTRRYACVVALGAIVRGETPHFDYIASECASGLQLAGIETGVPVAFGVLTVETVEQAEARIDRAAEAVRTALEMADVFAQLRASAEAIAPAAATLPTADVARSAQSVGRSRLREQPLALDGGDEAPLRPEPAAGPHAPEGLADAAPTSAPAASRAARSSKRSSATGRDRLPRGPPQPLGPVSGLMRNPWRMTSSSTWSAAGSPSPVTWSPRSSPSGTLGCYGVVGLSAGSRVGRILRREGISVDGDARCAPHRGARRRRARAQLAEVASTVRSQVAYEVERLTGLKVAAVEVVIERVRQSA